MFFLFLQHVRLVIFRVVRTYAQAATLSGATCLLITHAPLQLAGVPPGPFAINSAQPQAWEWVGVREDAPTCRVPSLHNSCQTRFNPSSLLPCSASIHSLERLRLCRVWPSASTETQRRRASRFLDYVHTSAPPHLYVLRSPTARLKEAGRTSHRNRLWLEELELQIHRRRQQSRYISGSK